MSECDLDTAVPDWIIAHPEMLQAFQEWGIDYCCGGKSLAFACQEAGLDAVTLLARIHQLIEIGDNDSFQGDRTDGNGL